LGHARALNRFDTNFLTSASVFSSINYTRTACSNSLIEKNSVMIDLLDTRVLLLGHSKHFRWAMICFG
jgi:hypothetical protein